jgi:hypothetical protein
MSGLTRTTPIVLTVIAVIATAATFVYPTSIQSTNNQPVRVALCDGIITDLSFNYTGSTGGLSPTPQEIPGACDGGPVPPSSLLTAWLLLHNGATVPHQILSVAFHSPYSGVGVNPALPVTVLPGANVSLDLTYKAPSAGGTYGLPAVLVTAS